VPLPPSGRRAIRPGARSGAGRRSRDVRARSWRAARRFLREAKTASRIDCPHVVRVLEVGTTAGEVPFLELARWFSAAVNQGLDLDQRRRADELIARYPWGTRSGASAAPWIRARDPDSRKLTIIDIPRV
jgi:hypothetical protein